RNSKSTTGDDHEPYPCLTYRRAGARRRRVGRTRRDGDPLSAQGRHTVRRAGSRSSECDVAPEHDQGHPGANGAAQRPKSPKTRSLARTAARPEAGPAIMVGPASERAQSLFTNTRSIRHRLVLASRWGSGWRRDMNQVISQIVQFLQQGIAAIFKFFQLIWTW